MFPERLLYQISRSNTNDAFPPTMQPVFCLSTRTEDMTSTFGKGRPLTKKKIIDLIDTKTCLGVMTFHIALTVLIFLVAGKEIR